MNTITLLLTPKQSTAYPFESSIYEFIDTIQEIQKKNNLQILSHSWKYYSYNSQRYCSYLSVNIKNNKYTIHIQFNKPLEEIHYQFYSFNGISYITIDGTILYLDSKGFYTIDNHEKEYYDLTDFMCNCIEYIDTKTILI